jgi:hypothetical protein
MSQLGLGRQADREAGRGRSWSSQSVAASLRADAGGGRVMPS